MVKHRNGIAIGVGLVLLAVLLWRTVGGRADEVPTPPIAEAARSGAAIDKFGARSHAIDPAVVPRGSIAGTVRDGTTPIAGAAVCVDLWGKKLPDELTRDPICVVTGPTGAYQFQALHPATYGVTAGKRGYLSAVFHPGGDRHQESFELATGEARTGVDFVLRPGGAELTGKVSDISGGPVAHARVRAHTGRWGGGVSSPMVETDDAGAFSLWIRPGQVRVEASADGYASVEESGQAPGAVELLLTPEASLSGTVVDAVTGAPVEGAAVSTSGSRWRDRNDEVAVTDAKGGFRIARLVPGRYVVDARTEQGYGRSEGSTLVGLGQHVTGVTVSLHAAARIVGTITLPGTPAKPCTEGGVSFHDKDRDRDAYARTEPDGTVIAEAVLPGTYVPQVWCTGYQSRDTYEPIVVADREVTGLTWAVDAAATVRGRVRTRDGTPVEGAQVSGRTVGGAARAKDDWSGDESQADGSYELRGLRPGSYKLDVDSELGLAPTDGYRIEVAAGATVERDLVIEDGGTIDGTVVDAAGKPIAGVDVDANALARDAGWSDGVKTGARGEFSVHPLRAGAYLVTVRRGWSQQLRKPGSTDDTKQGERATVRVGKTTTVKVVVEIQDGKIGGVVVDDAGVPVPDAYVSAARESDAAGSARTGAQQTRGWGWGGDRPALTATDGSFEIGALSAGAYTLRAYRKGGGEAIAEHVEVGSTTTLQIKATGSIAGVVTVAGGGTGGGAIEQLEVVLHDNTTGFRRTESFFRTAGRFTINDVPAGAFQLTASAAEGNKMIELPLAGGEARTGVTIELDPLLTLTGRVVDLATRAPVAGFRMGASLAVGGRYSFGWGDDDRSNITDDDGRFTVKRAPRGRLQIRGFHKEYGDSDYSFVSALRTVEGHGTVDLGELTVMKRRLKKGETAGELGVNFKERPPGITIDQWRYEVSYIDPAGPAARTELVVGDVVTSVDGAKITGEDAVHGWAMMNAPVGTKLALGLARGATVTVTLAAP